MSRPPRLGSFEYAGPWRYFATTCTFQRRPLFLDAPCVQRVSAQFLQTAEVQGCEVLAYCFMPDHAHLLVAGASTDANFPAFMKLAKQRSGFEYSRRTGGRLWQEGYYERVLRAGEGTRGVISYILANPVQAGLVADPIDYPFWGSSVYSREEILDFLVIERRT